MPLLRTSCSSRSATRCRPVRSSPRSFRSFGEALSFRSEPSCSTARSIASATGFSAGSIAAASSRSSGASCSSSAARARSDPETVSAMCRSAEAVSTPPRAASAVDLTNVADPLERRLLGDVEQRDRLGGQRLPARHLARVG